jgi:hypothetical protein
MRILLLLIIALILPLSVSASDESTAELKLASLVESDTGSTRNQSVQLALMCFKTGEQISGLNKLCFYDCAGSGASITVKAYQLCPLSINN